MKESLEIELAPVIHGKDDIKISIPTKYAKFIGLLKKHKKVFLIPTNDVLQISVDKPITQIPVLTLDNMDFEEHKEY